MTFKVLLDELRNGKTLEQICKEQDCRMVECTNNIAYYDTDLDDFLERVGARIIGFEVGFAIISTTDNKVYEVPCKELKNRFDSSLDDELILFFEIDKIYDVTEDYI